MSKKNNKKLEFEPFYCRPYANTVTTREDRRKILYDESGIWKGIGYCKDCNIPLRGRYSLRCKSCSGKIYGIKNIKNSSR